MYPMIFTASNFPFVPRASRPVFAVKLAGDSGGTPGLRTLQRHQLQCVLKGDLVPGRLRQVLCFQEVYQPVVEAIAAVEQLVFELHQEFFALSFGRTADGRESRSGAEVGVEV